MNKDILKQLDIFKNLNSEDLEKIFKITTIKKLQRDNILFYEQEQPEYFYALISGHLKLYKTGIKNNEIVLHYFTTPTMIAEMATLENVNFPATAVATKEDTIVALIKKEPFFKLLENDSQLSFHIIKSLTKKIKTLETTINRNLIFDATSKVCSYIDENALLFKNSKKIEIAKILNMAPETLSRVLAKLKELDIIDNEHNLKDKDKLQMFLNF